VSKSLIDTVLVRCANSVLYDPRVERIVSSLGKKYTTIVFGWNREGLARERYNDYTVDLELFNIKTTGRVSLVQTFLRLLFIFPLFWIWIFIKLVKFRPKVVYACDLDTIIPCYIYRIIFRKKLVFDVFDRYAMARISPKYKMVYYIVNFLEEFMIKSSDVLVVAGG
jgi:hypothetical protein